MIGSVLPFFRKLVIFLSLDQYSLFLRHLWSCFQRELSIDLAGHFDEIFKAPLPNILWGMQLPPSNY